jgi:CheY-like chemotaxis protein
LRNFIANALKFTERGEVRVSANYHEADRTVTFSVADTGFGIAPADQERIFEEFTQLANPVQRQVKGTGLGLPLCRKLATLLGGKIELQSQLQVGSTFALTVPIEYVSAHEELSAGELRPPSWELDDSRIPVLVVEDEQETRLIYEKFLRHSAFQMIAAASIRQARAAMRQLRPGAILLDIVLRGEDSWKWLAMLKADAGTRSIPVVVATMMDDQGKGHALGADDYLVKPIDRDTLLRTLARVTGSEMELLHSEARVKLQRRVLVIDDEPTSRYIIAKLLEGEPLLVRQASNGADGLRIAKEIRPRLIFLDLSMPDISGFDLLDQLKDDPATRDIPVVIVTSLVPSEAERARLQNSACAIISKRDLSRDRMEELLHRAFEERPETEFQPVQSSRAAL